MRKTENDCCGCRDVGLPCKGGACHNRAVLHFYCDKCGAEEKLYEYCGHELCGDCLLSEYPIVEGSDV